jgi:hypothetical protein
MRNRIAGWDTGWAARLARRVAVCMGISEGKRIDVPVGGTRRAVRFDRPDCRLKGSRRGSRQGGLQAAYPA